MTKFICKVCKPNCIVDDCQIERTKYSPNQCPFENSDNPKWEEVKE